MPTAKIRVLLADDHPIVLAGIRALVEADESLQVVGQAEDGRVALKLAGELMPDVAVLDISMPGLSGPELAIQLKATCPDCKLIALTVHEDRGYLRQLFAAGVTAYVIKRSATDELLRAIHIVMGGGVYIDPSIAGSILRSGAAAVSDHDDKKAFVLSDRELEVLKLTARGHSNKAIAGALKIGIKTVETYKSRAMEKLSLQTRVELVRYAASAGWFSDV